MNADVEQLRDLISQNKTEKVFMIFAQLSKSDPDLKNQVLTLQAKFNDIRKRENLGLINSGDAFIVHNQINFSMLNLLNEYEKNFSIDASRSKTVFISYNHIDCEIANKLKQELSANNINTIIDSENMQAGEDIKEFIEKSVYSSDVTISIISKESLLSAWVAMESITTFYHEKESAGKKFIACYVNDDFFKRQFTDEAFNFIDQQLNEIETIRKNRIEQGRNTRDLNNEYTRLKELGNGIDEIVRRLRENLCIDIRNENFDKGFMKILQQVEQ